MVGGVATPLAEVPFGEYAAIYDLIYRDKDYAAESAFVDSLIRLHRSPGGTQGCTPSSLTLSYHIARPSAFNTKSIGVGTGILLPAPPSEPDGRFSRIRLSSQ